MKNFVTFLMFSFAVFLAGPANALDFYTQWWYNSTSNEGVHDPYPANGYDEVRLNDDVNSGSIQGTVPLDPFGLWQITFFCQPDETWEIEEEYVKVFVNGTLVNTEYNYPKGVEKVFYYEVLGNSFNYRFEFYSPETGAGKHLVMARGRATLIEELKPANIPALSRWGMIVLFLLTIAAGVLVIRRRRA